MHPSALKTTEDSRKLSSLIKTYFAQGGKHIQFNVVGKETLLDAQKHPEKYRELVVRVAGYSAYYVQLSKAIQDEIMARTEHEMAWVKRKLGIRNVMVEAVDRKL